MTSQSYQFLTYDKRYLYIFFIFLYLVKVYDVIFNVVLKAFMIDNSLFILFVTLVASIQCNDVSNEKNFNYKHAFYVEKELRNKFFPSLFTPEGKKLHFNGVLRKNV